MVSGLITFAGVLAAATPMLVRTTAINTSPLFLADSVWETGGASIDLICGSKVAAMTEGCFPRRYHCGVRVMFALRHSSAARLPRRSRDSDPRPCFLLACLRRTSWVCAFQEAKQLNPIALPDQLIGARFVETLFGDLGIGVRQAPVQPFANRASLGRPLGLPL
jgi:hypothetical protein